MLLRFFFSALFVISTHAHADMLNLFSNPEFLPVEQAFPVSTQVVDKNLEASFTTSEGYYLYKHRMYLTQDGQTYWPNQYSKAGLKKEDENFGSVEVFYQNLTLLFNTSELKPTSATLHYQGCADAGLCYAPQSMLIDLSYLKPSSLSDSSIAQNAQEKSSPMPLEKKTSNNEPKALAQPENSWFANQSLWKTLGLFFLAGIALTFTPCVLPMVPILTSVVLGEEKRSAKNGFILSSLYVLGMAITFAIAGLSVGLLGAGANLQALMQTPWVLVIFALMFVLLALSMFGFYELSLPNALTQKLDKLSRKQKSGQGLGVFIMGVLSALVVSPCVSAPLAGALIYLSTTGDAVLGGLALLALGLGMGAPLIVLGTTGASLLPKAGMWMNQVKNLFGILLLAVAIWLLTRILPEGVSLLLWSALSISYAVYLGALEAASSSSQRIVKAFALILLIYGVSALIGFFQGSSNPLQPLANKASELLVQQAEQTQTESSEKRFYRVSNPSELDSLISEQTQPIMVDVYADWCISCKEMEKNIFTQQDIQKQLNDYQWIKFDITKQTDEQVRWLKDKQLFGPPTILFFKQGKEITGSRMIGEQHMEGFLKKVRVFTNH